MQPIDIFWGLEVWTKTKLTPPKKRSKQILVKKILCRHKTLASKRCHLRHLRTVLDSKAHQDFLKGALCIRSFTNRPIIIDCNWTNQHTPRLDFFVSQWKKWANLWLLLVQFAMFPSPYSFPLPKMLFNISVLSHIKCNFLKVSNFAIIMLSNQHT